MLGVLPGRLQFFVDMTRNVITLSFTARQVTMLLICCDVLRLSGVESRTVNWYLQGLRKYAAFSGRARRREFWMFELINSLIVFALFVIAVLAGKAGFGYLLGLPIVYSLATVIPSFAKLVRRLHDTNHSGWWFLIGVIPVVGRYSCSHSP